MCDSRWLFTDEDLANAKKWKTDGKQNEMSAATQLEYRQEGTKLIQDMGQRLKVSQLCINSAVVYFHRFYVFHPFELFHHFDIAAAAFYLAAKVEEHPRKAVDVINVLRSLMKTNNGTVLNNKEFDQKLEDMILHEDILMQTLGFEFDVVHPHFYVVQTLNKFRSLPGFEALGTTFYFMATSVLHLSTLCLKYSSSVIAALCIDIICKHKKFELPEQIEDIPWYQHVDENITEEVLTQINWEFMEVLNKTLPRFKHKLECIMKYQKTEVPKPPVPHRSTSVSSKALQEQHKNHQTVTHIPSRSNKEVISGSSKSLLGKRPHQEDRQNAHRGTVFKKISSTGDLSQSKVLKQQRSLNQLPMRAQSSESSNKYASPLNQSFIEESPRSVKESQKNKRKFAVLSDGELQEESDRESKFRKVDDLPKLTENYEEDSQPKTENTGTTTNDSMPHDLMNINVKLMFLPSDIVPFNQTYIPPDTDNFDDDLVAFKHEFPLNASDYNKNAENINAG